MKCVTKGTHRGSRRRDVVPFLHLPVGGADRSGPAHSADPTALPGPACALGRPGRPGPPVREAQPLPLGRLEPLAQVL